jgi:hypothetical protein
MGVKRFLELLGLPSTNEQGHELGCACDHCMAARERAQREPPKPGTVGSVLLEALRKRRERKVRR